MVPGLRLRQVRERLGLTFRGVECASYQVASIHGSTDFIIHISRLAAIENHGVIPSLHKMYAFAVIYHLDPLEISNSYGVPLGQHFTDSTAFAAPRTHMAAPPQSLRLPMKFDPAFDPRRTDLLNRMVEAWKDMEGVLFKKHDHCLYGYIGSEDRMMEPMLLPGTVVLIDPTKRQIGMSAWKNEFERPVYFVDLREEYRCSWCVQETKTLILQPHSLSPCAPKIFRFPDEADVVGQVVGSVKRLMGS